MEQFEDLESLLSSMFSQKIEKVHQLTAEGTLASSREYVKVVFEDGTVKHCFLKVRRAGSQNEAIDQVFKLFERETLMYTKVVPILAESLKTQSKGTASKDTIDIRELFPKYYGSGKINNDLFLVFEDILTGSETFVTSKTAFHTESQIMLTLYHLGTFHASSYLYKLQNKTNFLETYPALDAPVFHPDRVGSISDFFQGTFVKNLKIIQCVVAAYKNKNKIVCSKLSNMCEEEDIEKLLDVGDSLMEKVFQLLKPSSSSVITHGDFHMWNIAFDREPPTAVTMFDLQGSRVSSGVNDIVQYLYQVTTPTTRPHHLLQQYFREYCKVYPKPSAVNTILL